MKKKISIIFLLMIILLNSVVYATTLNLDVKSNKERLEVGEEVVITVDWKEGMQAADFILKYDDSKFEFKSIDIENDFYKVKDSQIEVVWISLDDVDKTSMNVIFKALNPGKSSFSAEVAGGFATGELVMPTDYNDGKTTVKVNGFSSETLLYIGIPVIIIIIAIFVIRKIKTKNK